jgi:hypothetical protein
MKSMGFDSSGLMGMPLVLFVLLIITNPYPFCGV